MSAGKAIFWGGFWCGVLDILSAIIPWQIRGIGPQRILHSVASGLIGREAALAGGWKTAFLGLACHFFVAFGVATTYYLVSRKLTFLTAHPVICGLIYGEIVYVVMNQIVLPLSAIHRPWFTMPNFLPWPYLVGGVLGHPFFVGLPVALAIAKWAPADTIPAHA